MKGYLAVFFFILGLTSAKINHTHPNTHHHHTHRPTTQGTTLSPLSTEARLAKMEGIMEGMARQLMLQQLFVEERIRSEGDSGVKQLRQSHEGTVPYFTVTHTGRSMLSIHDHSNYDRTCGMGEFIAVMNGVEFRTRHNDYKLRMPSTTSKAYNAVEYIPFPPVPRSVTQKATVQEQIAEMKEYFKAWKFQNHHHRDYRPYFKPVLCYLEGAWTTNTKSLDEPFQSDRHAIDASSWFDLQEKVRYTSYSGGKSNLENFSYLPTTVMNVINGVPEYAQWNYRILCHPLEQDLPLASLEPVDDLAARLPHKQTLDKLAQTRAARFHLSPSAGGSNYDFDKGYGSFSDKTYSTGLLDKLMNQIPGKNNYHSVLNDHSFGMTVYDPKATNSTPLNTAYYHRFYKYDQKGAMGTKDIHRGYADQNLFVAQNTQPQIAEMKVNYCGKGRQHANCTMYSSRYSYALPLEIIYLTPLYEWNPYHLADHGRQGNTIVTGHMQRNGGLTPDKAYNGTNYRFYYRTPAEFYSASRAEKDKADTNKGTVGILDQHGVVRHVVTSGTHIHLPEIEGVGRLRTRYPIAPVHRDGSSVAKELSAVKEMLNHIPSLSSLFAEPPILGSGQSTALVADKHFYTSFTNKDPPGYHHHDVFISKSDMDEMAKGAGHTITVATSTDNSHSHELEVEMHNGTYRILHCDKLLHCWDGHTNELLVA